MRDSLSALDQAIACCGTKLDAAEVRGMLGLFSLDSLGEVKELIVATNPTEMCIRDRSAVQFSVGGFRRSGEAHGGDLREGRD